MSNDSETTPLLLRDDNDSDERRPPRMTLRVGFGRAAFREEFVTLAGYSFPVFGSQLLEFSMLTVSILSIGHTSTAALSAVSLGTLTANVTAFTLMQGFAAALDTILPPAWTSSQPQLVGLWTQRMFVLMMLLMIPIYVIWFNAETLFLLFSQDPEVARLTSVYLRWLSLGLPAYAFNCISRRYFQCQGLFSAPTLIISIVAPINAILNYLLVLGPKEVRIGFIGAPIATAISYNLVSILSIAYGILYLPHSAWHPLSRRMFSNIQTLLVLGTGGAGQLASEWFALEIVAFAASLIGPATLASQSVLLTISSFFFQIFIALSVVTSVRIGNLLGVSNAERATVTTHTSLVMGSVISVTMNIALTIFREYWAYIFTDDPEVVEIVTAMIPHIAVFQVFDAVTVVAAGILRSQGRQVIGALLYTSAYYAIGLPLGTYLAFYWNLGLSGLWLGLTAGLVLAAITGTVMSLRTDWDKEVYKAMSRLKEHDKPVVPQVNV